MSETVDLLIIGGGPAGLAAAVEADGLGLSVLLLDEQTEPGGQIYRSIESVYPDTLDLLGEDYRQGAVIAERFRKSNASYKPGAAVWRVDEDGLVAYSQNGKGATASGNRVLVATGAMERPMPWPAPVTMTVRPSCCPPIEEPPFYPVSTQPQATGALMWAFSGGDSRVPGLPANRERQAGVSADVVS